MSQILEKANIAKDLALSLGANEVEVVVYNRFRPR